MGCAMPAAGQLTTRTDVRPGSPPSAIPCRGAPTRGAFGSSDSVLARGGRLCRGVSYRHPSLRSVQPRLSDSGVLGLFFNPDPGEALELGRQSRRAGAEERVEHRPSVGCDEPDEVAHEVDGFDGGMLIAPSYGLDCGIDPPVASH